MGRRLSAASHGQADSPAAVPVESEPLHRPVFSNDQVQVLDVVIPPEAATLFHTHEHDLLGVTISSAPSRNEVQGQKPTDKPEESPGEAWFMPFPKPWTHRLRNLGTKDIHYVVFQLLQAPAAHGLAPYTKTASPQKTVFENARVRVLRIDLAPGEESPEHSHSSTYGIVALTSVRIEEGSGFGEAFSQAGFVGWRDPSSCHIFRNAGDAPIQLLEIEICH